MADFNQAVQWIMGGKKVRKNTWLSKVYMFLSEGGCIEISSGIKLTPGLIEATDWEIYCEEHDFSIFSDSEIVSEESAEKAANMNLKKLEGIKVCKKCGIEKPKEIILEKRSFAESMAYLKAKFDVGDLNETMYKIQISAIVENSK